ncbi:MAG TPA: cytochrome d ubiquinol oxidase subunit II [Ktedonobacterales bacterium]|nr:cytochrome d ubiquinol oxidase subunit II [Ktedonobacterales bacterium]
MSQSTLAALAAALAWVALIAYAVLGGADFGGGVWDLLARGPTAERQRAVIARGMGPVWESNNVWLIFVLVVTWTAFPVVYAGISTALFIPITLVVIGIVLRGAAFSFRSNYGREVGSGARWGYVFSIASTITPFLFGTIAGALASGNIRVSAGPPLQVQDNPWATWTTPFALACGLFAVALCSVLAATYLTIDARKAGDDAVAGGFRLRALIAGAVTAALGALAAVLAISEAPTLWQGLIGKALPFAIAAVVIGLATAAALLLHLEYLARVLVAAETACIFLAWGFAQWPYLIVPDVTVDNGASPASVLGPLLIVSLLGLVVLLPSLWYLFRVVKRTPRPSAPSAGSQARVTTAAFVASLPLAEPPDAPLLSSDTLSAQTSTVALPGGPTMQRIVPVLTALFAIAAAPLITGVLEGMSRGMRRGMQQGLERVQRRRNQRHRSAHAH